MQPKKLQGSVLWLATFFLMMITFAGKTTYSQVTSAAIHGTVTDASGAVVPDAKVTATNTATGISTITTSNKTGYFEFPALSVGPYTLEVDAANYQKYNATGISLTANANIELNTKLSVGPSQTTVTVNASSIQVETSNTQLEQTVGQDQIDELPLFGRDAASLEKLAPGVVESSDRFGSYSLNGSQTTSNSFQVEGIDNNDGPLQDEGLVINPDALQEENVIASTINPEFARNGGAVINQVIKSGTNQIHGSGFEYYRDTFMNLGGYFATGHERPPFHQNLYGGTVGGPIIKNHFFGFLAYQGWRNRTGGITQTPVFQNGVVSQGVFTNETNIATGGPDGGAIDPTTGNLVGGLTNNQIPFDITTGAGATACGPGTSKTTWAECIPVNAAGTPVVVSPTSFNSISTALVNKFVPGGNAGSAGSPLYSFVTANTGAGDQGVLRADYHFSDKDTVYGTGTFQSSPSFDTIPFVGADLPGFPMVLAEHFKLFSGQETHTFSAKTLNVLRVGYYRFYFAAVEPAVPVAPSTFGFAISPQSSSDGLPNMGLTGLFTLGFSDDGPQPRKDTNLTYSDNLSHMFGNHELKMGATVEMFRVSNPFYADNNGSYSYGGSGSYSSGDPGIDFLLGIPDSYAQTSGGFIDAIAWEDYAFAQDSWHATSDLTVNYGLAWDAETPNNNTQFGGEGVTCFSLSSQTSNVYPGGPPGLTWPGDPGCNTSAGATPKYAHFGPRFGFAWSPSEGPKALIGETGAHKFSIRGGVGLYYNRDQEEGQLQNLGDTPNFKFSEGAADFGGSPSFANPFADIGGNGSETSPFPYTPPAKGAALNWGLYTTQDISEIAHNYSTPYIYNFNLNIQRELPGAMILQIGYVGSVGHKLASNYEADSITSAGHAACVSPSETVTLPFGTYTCAQLAAEQRLYFPQNTAQPAIFPGTGGGAIASLPNGLPWYLSVGTLNTEGSSNYNSLQISLNKNPTHGLSFTMAYTYSHALDNASGLESSGFFHGTNNVPGFGYLNYGDSDYDARQRFVSSYDYRVPLLTSMKENTIVNDILGNWHAAGFTVLQSGFPVVVTDYGTYNSLYCDRYSYYACPDNPSTSSFSIGKYNPRTLNSNGLNQGFNPSSFSQEPIGTFGNVKRNFFHGPGYNYTDMSLFKNVMLGRETNRTLQLMIQAQNLFNHANFAGPDGNYTDGPYFGTISSVKSSADYNGDPAPGRTVQLVGRITF
jgi:hypothetical protein